jgi:hypothetical protein
MPVVFSNPALLLGALAAGVPVLIHFLSLRKVRQQPFSDLRFLTEVQSRQARSLGVRRWLLLLMRVLAILLIALAVAGPRWGGMVTAGQGSRSLLFVIDTSASMNTQTDRGARLDQALEICRHMMDSLPDQTTVQVITSGSRTEALFGDWLPVGVGAKQGLAAVLPSDGTFSPAAVLRLAADQVVRAPAAQVQMIWISDLQEPALDAAVEQAAAQLNSSGRVQHLVRPVGRAAPGGGILAVTLPRRAVQTGENVSLSASVITHTPEEVLVLELDGRPVAEAVVPAVSPTPVLVPFTLPVPEPGLHRGLVRKQSDLFPADDQYPFVLEVPESLDVLIVHGRNRAIDGAGGRGGWRFLAKALAPGAGDQLLKVTSVESGNLTTGDLERHAVVYFVDPDPLGRRAQEGTIDWLNNGGAGCFLLGEPVQAGYYASTLLPALGWPGPIQDTGADAGAGQSQRSRVIDPAHPIFTGLEEDALGTLADVEWRRWFRLDESEGAVLMATTDDSPLLVTRDLGQGRVAVLPWHLDQGSNALATSPMALPLFQRLTLWLAGRGGLAAGVNTTVGTRSRVVPRLMADGRALERTGELKAVSDRGNLSQAADLVWRGRIPYLTGPMIDRAGFTAFLAGSDTVGLVAGTVPPGESVIEVLTAERWSTLMNGWGLADPLTLEGGNRSDQDDLGQLMAGHSLAPWLFLAAILLLLGELFVARGTGPVSAISG